MESVENHSGCSITKRIMWYLRIVRLRIQTLYIVFGMEVMSNSVGVISVEIDINSISMERLYHLMDVILGIIHKPIAPCFVSGIELKLHSMEWISWGINRLEVRL